MVHAVPRPAPLANGPLVADPSPPLLQRDARICRRIVAEELEKRLAPIRRSLARATNQEPTLRDVDGGIGWLVGLAGLAACAVSRRNAKSKE